MACNACFIADWITLEEPRLWPDMPAARGHLICYQPISRRNQSADRAGCGRAAGGQVSRTVRGVLILLCGMELVADHARQPGAAFRSATASGPHQPVPAP